MADLDKQAVVWKLQKIIYFAPKCNTKVSVTGLLVAQL